MILKLVRGASKTWRRLKGENRSPSAVARVTFTDRVAATAAPDHRDARSDPETQIPPQRPLTSPGV